ncbi:MAG TPA: ABC transporter substrate-binding protein [Dongiaceae bacterium]|jgi:peptide/nickel transport system substrate-binding protein|nr:ABC transporter substrate-binding protein [Dongiaceae bacterium]
MIRFWSRRHFLALSAGLGASALARPSRANTFIGAPYFADAENSGDLPPVSERLPKLPAIADMPELGQYGGEITMLMGSAKDTRILVAYSYARLVRYTDTYKLVPDILADFEVEQNRIFTFHLRPGHKWSSGKPFTSDDFRYWWQDVALNPDLSPAGPPIELVVDGERPKVEFIDEVTVRYSWSKPNPEFLPALAGAEPLYIFRPAHYLKKYHARYQKPDKLAAAVKEAKQRNWAALHNRKDNLYRNDNPKLPTLDPWLNHQKPPADRFVFTRNPYYYRVDRLGRQLPYLDQIVFVVADPKIIPAKTGAGESDLQGRNIRFDNYTFLKSGERQGKPYQVRLWEGGIGSNFALYPNLTCNDPVWRTLNRDVSFRRALSLGINRHEINEAIYFGLGLEGANTILPRSPLYKPEYRAAWSDFDPVRAGIMLDKLGLDKRDDDGWRLLPDGRRAEIIVETAGESTAEADVLELIRDSWAEIGVKLFPKPSQREVFRDRLFGGEAIMAVWLGLDDGFPDADDSPHELCPSSQQQLQWCQWGQYIETKGKSGKPVDMPEAQMLVDLLTAWRVATESPARQAIWAKVLSIWADQVYTLGTVANVPQPVVVNKHLHNVPLKAIWAWEPGAQIGVFKPDTFWLDEKRPLSKVKSIKEES